MKKLLFFIIAVALIGAGFYLSRTSVEQLAEEAALRDDVAEGESPVEQPVPDAQGISTYSDSEYDFSLSDPSTYNVGKISSEDGDTFVIEAGPEFKLLGKNTLDDMAMATPAALRGSLLLRTRGALYRIARQNGSKQAPR